MTPNIVLRLERALGPELVLACRAISEGGRLTKDEGQAIARAVPDRRTEFAAGRSVAREALAKLGQNAVSIPIGPGRAPIWPAGIVGSISHGAGIAVALVASSDRMLAVGIDIEPNLPLPDDVMETVLRPDEQDVMGRARAVFCAKEATYKALFPISGEIWDFADMRIRLDQGHDRFSAELCRSAGPLPIGSMLHGHLLANSGICLAAMTVPKP